MLAAAAAVVTATAAIAAVVAAAQTVVATAAEQDQQDDDPAHIPTAETVVTHKITSANFVAVFAAHSKIFQRQKKVHRPRSQARRKEGWGEIKARFLYFWARFWVVQRLRGRYNGWQR